MLAASEQNEIFSVTNRDNEKLFEVITIGETGELISARNGLKILPKASFKDKLRKDIRKSQWTEFKNRMKTEESKNEEKSMGH